MTGVRDDQKAMPGEPPPSLIFEMVADIAILQAAVAGLGQTNPAALAAIRGALNQLAVQSVQVGQHMALVRLMDDTMQRRIAAFEARLPRHDAS